MSQARVSCSVFSLNIFRLPILLSITLTSCGPLLAPGSQEVNTTNQTLATILAQGFPAWERLAPTLPHTFSQGEGVATDSLGNPLLARNLEKGLLADALAIGGAQEVVAEALALSRESLALARASELVTHQILAPLFDILGNARLFAELDAPTSSKGVGLLGVALVPPSAGVTKFLGANAGTSAESTTTHALFRMLAKLGSLTILLPVPEKAGPNLLSERLSPETGTFWPAALTLEVLPGSAGIALSPLWARTTGDFVAPVTLTLALTPTQTSVKAIVAPGAFATKFLPQATSGCAKDLLEVNLLSASSGERSLEVMQNRCVSGAADKKNTGGFSLSQTAKGALTVSSAFKVSQDLSKAGGLRKSFGERPLLALRAAAHSKTSPLAVDIFAEPGSVAASATEPNFSDFGISQLLTRYVVTSFWNSDTAKIPGVETALCGVGGALSEALNAFCTKKTSGDAALAGFKAAALQARTAKVVLDFVTDGDALIAAIDSLVAVLEIRNTMFLKVGRGPQYAPSVNTLGEDEERSRATLGQVKAPFALAAAEQLNFEPRVLTAADLAKATRLTQASLFEGALRASCEALLKDSMGKAGKEDVATAVKVCDKN